MLKSQLPVDKTASANPQPGPARTPEPVRVLDLRRQYEQIRTEVLEAIARVCDAQQFVLGDEVAAFEREAAGFLGARRAVACASGTDALWLALVASGVRPGDEVVTTPFSFFATVSAIVRAEARPVLADVEPGTLNLDPAQVKRKLRGGARAVMPVHLYGQCADMTAFAELAREHDCRIVEDAAQAFGASWNGTRAGALGTAAGFSFYPTKNLSAFGDAGCVTTNSDEIAEHVLRLRNHGSRQRYHHEEIGANSRLDGIQGAVLRVKLKYIERWNQARRERAERYGRLFAEAGLANVPGASQLSAAAPVRLLTTRPEAFHIYHQYVIRAYRRDELRQSLTQRGIGSEVYYPIPLHLQPCFTYLGYREGDLPVAEQAAREVLALPMYPELAADEQQRVVEAIAEFYA